MKNKIIASMTFVAVSLIALPGNLLGATVSDHNIVWDTPSENEHGSMPIGNGDLAANVWVEPSGDLVFYISKSDAWSGNGRLLKLGRVRIKTKPAIFVAGDSFTHELDLENGTINISSGNKHVSFWIDANRPVIHVECESEQPLTATATLETWRTARRPLVGMENHSARGLNKGPKIYVEPDTIMPAKDSALRWCHRNQKSCYPVTLEKQHLGHLLEKYPDPLMNRTFGGLIKGNNMVNQGDSTLVSKGPSKQITISVHALTEQCDTLEAWEKRLQDIVTANDRIPLAIARTDHNNWWKEFWGRSKILISGSDDATSVSLAYTLQRWIQACAGRGDYPIKFNGSLFTVAASDKGEWDADYRRWGGCYWFQNTRHSYWPMLASGDFDQMEPFWKMYRDSLPLLKDRVNKYFEHDGIHCSETMYFWGTYCNSDFGWRNKGVLTQNSWLRLYWDSGNELSMMMLDYYHYTQNTDFAKTTLLPIADEVVTFYDQHYKRNDKGKVHFSPAMGLETWHRAEDPLPLIIGLDTVLAGLLALPESLTTDEQRQRWARFKSELPAVPTSSEDGKTRLLPAKTYSAKRNAENPELYSVFPYRAYTMHQPDLEVALETWRMRLIKSTGCWRQDPIQAALLGLTKEVQSNVVSNAKAKHSESRFPAFWAPHADWVPDQDHGSVTMTALQRMLMQCEGETIYLLPAWPQEWNVDFKLHAPLQTTVEGRIENGKVIDLKVTPESRRKDVELMNE